MSQRNMISPFFKRCVALSVAVLISIVPAANAFSSGPSIYIPPTNLLSPGGSGSGSSGSGSTQPETKYCWDGQQIPVSQNCPDEPAYSVNIGPIVGAIDGLGNVIVRLGNKIEAIALAAVDLVNDRTYQINPSLPKTIEANTANVQTGDTTVTPEQFASATASATSQLVTDNSLAQIAYSITPPPRINRDAFDAYQKYLNDNSVTTLTEGIKANDSPFFINEGQAFTWFSNPEVRKTLSQAENDELEKNNKIFNFGNIITPTMYTPEQGIAASRFIQFATQSFKPLTSGAKLDQLRNANEQQLYELVTSPEFQQYQLNTRSRVAIQSIMQTLMNELVAERTPVKGLNAGAKKNVSPLELEKYIATRRSEDANWYRDMSIASPATLQREMLNVLVEIQRQNHQAHLDRQRIMSALLAIALQNNQTADMNSQAQASDINDKIDDILGRNTRDDSVAGSSPGGNYMPDKSIEDLKKSNPDELKKAKKDSGMEDASDSDLEKMKDSAN